MTQSFDVLMRVESSNADADNQDLNQLASQLRRELLTLDVDKVELVREGHVPRGAKPVEIFAIGAILATLAPELIAGVCEVIAAWLGRSAARSVELEINGQRMKITAASRRDTDRYVSEFKRLLEQQSDEGLSDGR